MFLIVALAYLCIKLIFRDQYLTVATIKNLPDDCLFKVFECLFFNEKVAVQRVCKQWQIVSTQSLKYCQKQLRFETSGWIGNKDWVSNLEKPHVGNLIRSNYVTNLTNSDFDFLIKYQLINVKKVTFSAFGFDQSNAIVLKSSDFICLFQFFPKLVILELLFVVVLHSELESAILSKAAKNLTEFSAVEISGRNWQGIILSFLKDAKHLKKMTLKGVDCNKDFIDTVLKQIPTQVETLF